MPHSFMAIMLDLNVFFQTLSKCNKQIHRNLQKIYFVIKYTENSYMIVHKQHEKTAR